MQRTVPIVAILLWAAVVLTGCGSDDNNPPPPPSVGTVQIDRMGRAGVNTALTNPFFRETVAR